MSLNKVQFYFDPAFHFPKEHGFSVIILCSVAIGIILSFTTVIDYVGLVLSVLFALVVFLSNTSIIQLAKSKFKKIHVIPVVSIIILGIILLAYNTESQNIFIFIVTGFAFIIWLILNILNRGHTTDELVIGTLTLTLFTPLIFINAIDSYYMTEFLFVWIMLIYWLVAGFCVQLILYVQYVRKLFTIDNLIFIWLCFLVSLIPFYYLGLISQTIPLLSIKTIIVLIEPTIFLSWLYIKQPSLPDKPVFKKLGKVLSARLLIYILLLTIAVFVI